MNYLLFIIILLMTVNCDNDQLTNNNSINDIEYIEIGTEETANITLSKLPPVENVGDTKRTDCTGKVSAYDDTTMVMYQFGQLNIELKNSNELIEHTGIDSIKSCIDAYKVQTGIYDLGVVTPISLSKNVSSPESSTEISMTGSAVNEIPFWHGIVTIQGCGGTMSGAIISDNLIVTSAHGVDGCDKDGDGRGIGMFKIRYKKYTDDPLNSPSDVLFIGVLAFEMWYDYTGIGDHGDDMALIAIEGGLSNYYSDINSSDFMNWTTNYPVAGGYLSNATIMDVFSSFYGFAPYRYEGYEQYVIKTPNGFSDGYYTFANETSSVCPGNSGSPWTYTYKNTLRGISTAGWCTLDNSSSTNDRVTTVGDKALWLASIQFYIDLNSNCYHNTSGSEWICN